MPVTLITDPTSGQRYSCSQGLCRNPSAQCLEKASRTLHVGLVNNMPDGALEATERQFTALLEAASEGYSVQLSLYSLPGIARSEQAAQRLRASYRSVETLLGARLDGIIVTGKEPLMPRFSDEPYWEGFTRLLGWARENTFAAVWSCLAAHAAVFCEDGIERVRSEQKNSGVFDCERIAEHPLTAGVSPRFRIPHSRWNGLPADALTASGYEVLSQTVSAGVDTFVRRRNSLFVYFQGHPEYEPNTLLLEYRRDVARYLRGESDAYPRMPQNYFPAAAAEALAAVQAEAQKNRGGEWMPAVDAILDALAPQNQWQPAATAIYSNWLQYLSRQKELFLGEAAAAHNALRSAEADSAQTRRTAVPATFNPEMHNASAGERAVRGSSFTIIAG
jgi:homoserine O-succinyltransferase/O-acetyltransferase